MVMFGLDISHHQDLALDLARCKREGISFIFLKATEGNGFTDSEFTANLAEARRAGLMVAAYHYVKGDVSASSQVAHIARTIPKNVPVIPDVEAGGGWIALTREFITRLREAGYRVPLLYLPKWYWQQIGSPPLAGLPPLWASRYPDNVVGTLADEWDDVPSSYWTGHGGLPVAVLQFTSSARIAGHAPLDANAYRGTPAQLAALLGGEVETDMDLTELRKWKPTDGTWKVGGDGTFEHWVAYVWQMLDDIPAVKAAADAAKAEAAAARKENGALAAKLDTVGEQIEFSVTETLTRYFQNNPPTVSVDNAAIAAAVVAEFKKEGN